MTTSEIAFGVFTKPWKMPLPELAAHVRQLGYDAIELPVRPGFQVEPDKIAEDLPRAVKDFADHGVTIASIAGPTDERTIAACADAGVPIIRTMVEVDDDGYLASEARAQKDFDSKIPLLDRYGVKIGVQNHCDRYIANAMGLLHLMEKYDPKHIGAVWDAAHSALNGEDPELGLDIVWSHLCMVNLKNAFWERTTGPEAENVEWRHYWTSGRQGLASWPRVAAELKRRGYTGVICITAEYDDQAATDRLAAEDVAYARSLFA